MDTNAIKGGEFIIRDVSTSEVFTPEEWSEEQNMIAQMCDDFIIQEIIPNLDRIDAMEEGLMPSIMKKAGSLGLLGMSVPEDLGGLGVDFKTSLLATEYLGKGFSFSVAYGAHTGIGTLPLLYYGNEEQKKKYIPKLASGEWKAAYCLTEPGSGSDANSGKTTAELSADGKTYKINGQKMWISNAGFCSLMIVFARIEDDKNITGFIVEFDPENPNGVTLGEEEQKLGIRASSTRQVFFNDTEVPVDNMLAGRGEGFKIAMNALNVGRIKLAAACLDSQRRILTTAVNYANERKQFKTPIADFGAIKTKLAKMATSAYAGESATYRAAKNIEDRIAIREASGNTHQEAELKGVEEYAIECSILKVAVSEDVQNCADEGIQIFGGMGFSEETPMEAAWRDARIARIYEGTNEINRMLSVGMLVKKAMKGHVDLLGPAQAVQQELMGIPSFETPDYSKLFSEEKEMIKKLKKTFLMVAGAAVQKYGQQLEDHQQLLIAAADILIEIYIAESTVLRTEKNVKRFGEESQSVQIAMSKLYLYNAINIIEDKGKESIISFAEGDEQRMMLMGLKRFTKYTNYPDIVDLRNEIAEKVKAENKYCF